MHLHLELLESRILQSATPSPILPGDLNRDGKVNYDDMVVVTACWDNPGPNSPGDANGDSKVNFTDMLVVTGNWNRTIYDGHSSIINGVLNVWAPNPNDIGTTWMANDSQSLWGTDNTPQYASIKQGQIADCYLLAAIAGLALQRPQALTSAVAFDGIGWQVTWKDLNTGAPLVVHTSRELSEYLQANTGETYWEAIEKTFAFFRTWNGKTSLNTFKSLDYGYEGSVLRQLTGAASQGFTWVGFSATDVALQLGTAIAKHQVATWDTRLGAPSMVSNHVYLVVSISGTTATLYNPWGNLETHTIEEMELNGQLAWQLGGVDWGS